MITGLANVKNAFTVYTVYCLVERFLYISDFCNHLLSATKQTYIVSPAAVTVRVVF